MLYPPCKKEKSNRSGIGGVKKYINFLDYLQEKSSCQSSCLVFNFVYISFKKNLKRNASISVFSCSLHFSGQKVLWLAGVTT